MKEVLIFLSIAVIAYLLGSVNPSIVISKVFFKKDIRTLGSGNAGFTNMYRNFGAVPACFALVLDPGKAVLSVFFGQLLATVCNVNPLYGAYVAAVFVVLGHLFPVFFKFRGGKGVLTMAGSIILIHPYMLLIGLGLFILTLIITKYVSLGSMIACGTLFIQIIIGAAIHKTFSDVLWFEVVCAFILGGLIVFMHRQNIKRLIHGNERKITDKKKKAESVSAEHPINSTDAENNSKEIKDIGAEQKAQLPIEEDKSVANDETSALNIEKNKENENIDNKNIEKK